MKYIKLLILLIISLQALSQPIKQPIKALRGREADNILFNLTLAVSLRERIVGHRIPFTENFSYASYNNFLQNWDSSGVEFVNLLGAPSTKGVRFNGIRYNGDPYSVDTTVRVLTDSLISKLIISASSPVIEFSWQGGGAGVKPDSAAGDRFILYIEDQNRQWKEIWRAPDNFDRLAFNHETIAITEPVDSLRFKFESTGLSRATYSPWYLTAFEIESKVNLPFWEDFSNAESVKSHFKFNTGVYINNNWAINMPSINVASFDGLDDFGNPYYPNSVTDMGEADSLVSQPIDLSSFSVSDSLRFSFYYQKGGYGEMPDLTEGDSLMLLFLDDSSHWEPVWSSSFTEAADSTQFSQVLLTVTDSGFFHDGFKFMFFNYSRLSGSFDLWHVDYITLDTIKTGNLARSIIDNKLVYSDWGISRGPSILTAPYRSSPFNHTKTLNFKPDLNYSISVLSNPVLVNHVGQLIISGDTIGLTNPPVLLMPTGNNEISGDFPPFQKETLFNESFTISARVFVNPSPNISGYNFEYNDAVTTGYVFDNYYAYDDGDYEFGVMVEQDKALHAMEFNMLAEDTISHIDICIPYMGYHIEGSRFFLKIWENNNGKPGKELYSGYESAKYSIGRNSFTRYAIRNKGIILSGKFFIGYQQVSGFSQALRIGYDVNNNNKDKLWYDNNRGFGWSQDRNVDGTLMIRPVFDNVGILPQERKEVYFNMEFYPNPNNTDHLNFNAVMDWIELIDFNLNRTMLEYNTSKLDISALKPGIYFVKGFVGDKIYSKKLIIQD